MALRCGIWASTWRMRMAISWPFVCRSIPPSVHLTCTECLACAQHSDRHRWSGPRRESHLKRNSKTCVLSPVPEFTLSVLSDLTPEDMGIYISLAKVGRESVFLPHHLYPEVSPIGYYGIHSVTQQIFLGAYCVLVTGLNAQGLKFSQRWKGMGRKINSKHNK